MPSPSAILGWRGRQNQLGRVLARVRYKESVERCNKAFAAVTEANMAERAGATSPRSKIGALMYNTRYTNEHYGNIVTYIRLNGMVPPSTAER
jgi:hypothetical protein